jgi:hypothetical protein
MKKNQQYFNDKKINPALWSVQLLGLWGRISQLHLGSGLGCPCSTSMPSFTAGDLELSVLEYLDDKYQENREFHQWLVNHTDYKRGQSASIASFLRAMATQTPSNTLATLVLSDLKQTLESMQMAHSN